jgi:hypothetical protein
LSVAAQCVTLKIVKDMTHYGLFAPTGDEIIVCLDITASIHITVCTIQMVFDASEMACLDAMASLFYLFSSQVGRKGGGVSLESGMNHQIGFDPSICFKFTIALWSKGLVEGGLKYPPCPWKALTAQSLHIMLSSKVIVPAKTSFK